MSNEANKRIAKNTVMLYIRMIFSMLVSLYTARVILNTLGVEDYGINNVVAGFVSMFSLMSGSLSSATQRFLTFELGKNDLGKLKTVFCTSINIYLVISVLVLILGESVGLWFLNTQLNIASERMYAANWVYQCSLASFIISLISVSYNASIIAHEKMSVYAYVEIINVCFRLLIVYLLVISNFDKLITFAVLGLCVSVIIQTIYMFYCHRKFEECTYRFIWNKVIFQKMLAFAGWNFIGAGSAVLKSQGINILLNLFYGVIVNAAQGVANKVNTVINGFAMNISVAINPQITKSYASGDYDRLMALIYKGTKLIFFLLLFLTLPVMIETEIIMKLWLKLVPDYTVIFIRLILVETVINSLSSFLITAMLATGKIRNYQLVVGGIYFLNIPFSYLFMKLCFPPYITIIVAIFFAICCLFARLYMLRNMIKLSAKKYFSEVVVKALVVTAISLIFPLICYFSIEQGIGRFFIVCFVCVISSLTSIYYLGLAKTEKTIVLDNVKLFIKKFQR